MNIKKSSNLFYFTIIGFIWILSFVNGQPCSFPGSPAHSSVIFSDDTLNNGAIASYTCERGFELLGPGRRVCDNGVWVPEGIPFCVLNVAAGKAPMQISTDAGGIPQKAIDGSTSSFYTTDTCSLTKPERVPWWYVNLLEPYMVQLVRLDFGKACCGNNKPATIVVRVGNNRPDLGTNPICNRFTGVLEEGQPLFLPCNPPMPGAFVSVHLEVNTPSPLSICEAFVYTDQALPIERCPGFRDQPPGASASYNGKCYIFYNRQPLKFEDALKFCNTRGGTLINESNPALQGFISWELWRRHRSDSSSQYWMGAVRDSKDRNIWRWVGDGDEVTVSFWNLPSGNENCARYDGSKGWLWSDTNCDMPLNFICQHQPKSCGRPEQPPNSTMITPKGFNVGAIVDYNCDDGHLLVGPSTRTCLETGFYNEFPPVCKYIECGLPASIPHGSYDLINGTVGYLSVVNYKCNDGYEMVGRARLTCDIDERWNGPPPRCEIIECDMLPTNYENAKILTPNGTFYNSKAEIVCPKGYKLDGSRFITCLGTGQWSSTIPACIKLQAPSSEIQPTTVMPVAPKITTRQPPSQPTYSNTRYTTYRPKVTSLYDVSLEDQEDIDDGGISDELLIPGTVREEFPPRRTVKPTTVYVQPKNGHANNGSPPVVLSSQTSTQSSSPARQPPSTITTVTSPPYVKQSDSPLLKVKPLSVSDVLTSTIEPHSVILNAHPQDNEIAGSVNIKSDQSPNVNIPLTVENDSSKESQGAKLNLGAIVALGAFGGFVFLAAFITTIVIVVRRNRTAKHYRHRASPDCNTVASFDSSSSESRNGLNRYYRQAWENLHESASKNSAHNQLRRKETLDPPNLSRSRDNLSRSRDNLDRGRDYSRDSLGLRDGSEMVVSDVCVKGEKKRHHHHHHKNSNRNDYKDSNNVVNGGSRHHRHSNGHY